MEALVKVPDIRKTILTNKSNRHVDSIELDYRGLILNPVSRPSDSFATFGLITDFPTTDLGSWASGST